MVLLGGPAAVVPQVVLVEEESRQRGEKAATRTFVQRFGLRSLDGESVEGSEEAEREWCRKSVWREGGSGPMDQAADGARKEGVDKFG